MDAVPSGLKMLYKNTFPQSSIQSLDLVDTAVGQVCFSSSVKHNNRQVQALFQKDVVFRPPIVTFWNSRVDGLIWHNIWKLPHEYLITNKVKYISFKLIYKYYPSNYFLVNRFNCNIDTRIFCGLHIETFFHLFWSCPYSANFWSDFCSFVRDHNMPSFQLCFENVLLVFSTYDMSFHKEYYFTNLLLLN